MLLWLETKKTLFSPVLIGFLVVCIAVNIFTMFTYGYAYNYAERESEPYNVFEGYDASELAEKYIRLYGMTGNAENNMRVKYRKLQSFIDEKAANGDALSTYYGKGTPYIHNFLFGQLFLAIIAETALIALFAALLTTGYENTHNTEQLICAAKIGRKITWTKLVASLITGFIFFVVIVTVSLAIFLARYDFSVVWGDNVSSSFNALYGDPLNQVISWGSFTITELLWATIGAAAGLTIIFNLLGFAVGTFCRNTYVACGIAVALLFLQFLTPLLFQMGGTIAGILNLSPVMLWRYSGRWFTDGGEAMIWAHFETIGLTVSFITLMAAGFTAAKLYKRRNLL